MNDSPNIRSAREVYHKFEFYLVALAFTVAGFAIQTGKDPSHVVISFLEVASWVFLILSGVLGLWRLEVVPPMYLWLADAEEKEKHATKFPTSLDLKDDPEIQRQFAAVYRNRAEGIRRSIARRYYAQRWLLLLGFGCLVVSRAFLKFSAICAPHV